MKNKIIKYVNFGVIFFTSLIVLLAGVFVLLNWPSYWQRLKGISWPNKEVEAKGNVNNEIDDMVDVASLNQEKKYPELFVSSEVLGLENEYISKINDEWLSIPSLKIDAPVIYLDSLDNDLMSAKLKEGVVHYPNTALPGQRGNVFIFGHSSYYWWDWSKYNSVFANLEGIKKGDKIFIKTNGNIFIYQVIETKVVEKDDLSVLQQGNGFDLTLMTCTPLGTDLKRFIVEAKLVN